MFLVEQQVQQGVFEREEKGGGAEIERKDINLKFSSLPRASSSKVNLNPQKHLNNLTKTGKIPALTNQAGVRMPRNDPYVHVST